MNLFSSKILLFNSCSHPDVSLIRITTNNYQPTTITVAADGSENFKTIQAAVESVTDSAASYSTVIFIKNGTYREKVYLKTNGLTLRGETSPQKNLNWKESTGVKIIYAEAREIFRNHRSEMLGGSDTESKKTGGATDDWGASVLNIKANDISLENLVVLNDYGFEAKGDSTVMTNVKSITVNGVWPTDLLVKKFPIWRKKNVD